MAEKTTVARPYAQAAFELAQQADALKEWSAMLQFAAALAADRQMRDLIGNPRYSGAQLAELLLNIGEGRFDATAQNFIRVLADNKRLNVLPEIAALYERHRAEAEKSVEAEVISAFGIDPAIQTQLAEALKKRLGREVRLTTRIDESLIGGAIVRAGDTVFDGSVSGQLNKLAHALMQ